MVLKARRLAVLLFLYFSIFVWFTVEFHLWTVTGEIDTVEEIYLLFYTTLGVHYIILHFSLWAIFFLGLLMISLRDFSSVTYVRTRGKIISSYIYLTLLITFCFMVVYMLAITMVILINSSFSYILSTPYFLAVFLESISMFLVYSVSGLLFLLCNVFFLSKPKAFITTMLILFLSSGVSMIISSVWSPFYALGTVDAFFNKRADAFRVSPYLLNLFLILFIIGIILILIRLISRKKDFIL